MELVLGKKFKLEVWEVIVQKMSLNEVAKFTVHKTVSFPSPPLHYTPLPSNSHPLAPEHPLQYSNGKGEANWRSGSPRSLIKANTSNGLQRPSRCFPF